MRRLNTGAPRIAGLLALALGAVALLALSGAAAAKDRRADDHGHHGRHHHHHHEVTLRETGTITSFDATTGKLTIALEGGGSVAGLVTANTRIKCEGADNRLNRSDHGSDDNGGQGAEPGDDNGGGAEPDDDHGGESGSGTGDSSGPGPSGESGAHAEGNGANCGVASLVPGATVGEAELRLGGGAATFEKVELGEHS